MKKEVFVTSELCKIRDQIAEAAKKTNNENPAENTQENQNTPEPVVSPFERLSEETRRALNARHEEYERFRKEVILNLHKMIADCNKKNSAAQDQAQTTEQTSASLKTLLDSIEKMPELDRYSEDFQLKLSDNCRTLDHTRLEMIELNSHIPETPAAVSTSQKDQDAFLANLSSMTFGQFFRIGFSLFLPLILVLLLTSVLLAAVLVLTFRVSL